jgi:hypothetical protein
MTDQTDDKPNISVMLIDIGMTRQPRQYQSVRVAVTLPVFVTQTDDVHALLAEHLAKAKRELEEQIDQEFENYDEPAPYSKEPRFMLLLAADDKLSAIVPEMPQKDLPAGWDRATVDCKKHRLSYVRRQTAEWPNFQLADCSDGDLSKLPVLQHFELHRNKELGYAVLVLAEAKFPERDKYPGWWSSYYYLRLPQAFTAELIAKATADGTYFFDCTDGDFTKLPPPPAPKPDEVAATLEDDDDYDDDAHEDDN